MPRRILPSLARSLLSVPAESRTGRLLAPLRNWVRSHRLDVRNLSEFEDISVHERMLADRVRVDTYARAIERQIGPDDVVLDLGTGTGILAFLAAKRARKVYAVDHSAILHVAKRVADANGLNNIEFVRTNSREFTPPEPISVVLHEQIGDELFEENIVENVVDLRKRLLRPGGRIVPARVALYIEPVMLKDEYSTPFIWQMKIHGIDYTSLRHVPELSRFARGGNRRWQHRLEVERLVGEPAPVHTLDLATVETRDLPKHFRVKRSASQAGRLDGLLVWVAVDFGDGIGFDTSPSTCTSWGNHFFRVPPTELAAGDLIDFTVDLPDAHDIASWQVHIDRPNLGRVGE